MNILAICGSHRRGNTEQMLNWVLGAARKAGAKTTLVTLRSQNIGRCTGCNVCYGKSRKCVIKDDMSSMISKMKKADAIVFGSPNYFNNISALMKNFIDRNNSICEPSVLKGKLAAFVCVGARSVRDTKVVDRYLQEYVRLMRMKPVGSVIARAESPRDAAKQKKLKAACIALGRKLVRSLC
jgi:multimeric flavodoxin WrbA